MNKWELRSSSHNGWCRLKLPIQIILARLIIQVCWASSAKVLWIVLRLFEWSPSLYILRMEMGPVSVLMVIITISWELTAICCQELVVIETGEVIYITITDHSKTAGSITHRHTTTLTRWIQQYMLYTLPPNAPQTERTTRSTIEAHTSSSGAHILTLFDWIKTTLLYHWIPNGITPHTYLFPFQRQHVRLSIGIHVHIMQTSQLPIEHRPFLYHPLAP